MDNYSVKLDPKTYQLAQTIAEAQGITIDTLVSRLIINHARALLKLDEKD